MVVVICRDFKAVTPLMYVGAAEDVKMDITGDLKNSMGVGLKIPPTT